MTKNAWNIRFVILLFSSILLNISCIFFFGCDASIDDSLLKYVDPFIGTENGGHTFVGATLPFGMVKLGPDYGERQSNSGYYEPWYMQNQDTLNNPNHGLDTLKRDIFNQRIQGFSHIHVSGTGGGPKYGNILVKPTTGDIQELILNYSSNKIDLSENVSPGYYSVEIESAKHDIIRVELTASHKVGFHKYYFPKTDKAIILLDVSSFLGKYHCCNENQTLVNSGIKFIDSQNIAGYSTIKGGWNIGEAYTVFFYATIDIPSQDIGLWKDENIFKPAFEQIDTSASGAYFCYNTNTNQTIQLKIGISYISIQKAKESLNSEISNWNFEKVKNEAENKWEKALGKIKVQSPYDSLKTMFYTALYHTLLMPTDRTDENPYWQSNEPYYDDYYAIWDTYRTTHPLLTLIDPERQIEIIRSLIDIYVNEGYMPDARSGNCNGRTQGGSTCDILIADAFIKDLGIDKINYDLAFQALIKNADISPLIDCNSILTKLDSTRLTQKHGRGGLSDYINLGYVSNDVERAGTRTLEYAYCDWAIAQMAKKMNKMDQYNKYMERADNWKSLWNENIVDSNNIKGFIWPRTKSGLWVNEKDFSVFEKGSWTNFFYEGNSWEYSFFVPHDIESLIAINGGRDKFISRLDMFFDNEYYNVTNEPDFFTPYLYIYVNEHDKTVKRVRDIINKSYNISRSGLPGNDDSGAMSSWFAFNAIGLYPVVGTDEYLIVSPFFESISIKVNNNEFNIVTENFKKDNICIDRVILNGKVLEKFRISYFDILSGGTLKIIMK